MNGNLTRYPLSVTRYPDPLFQTLLWGGHIVPVPKMSVCVVFESADNTLYNLWFLDLSLLHPIFQAAYNKLIFSWTVSALDIYSSNNIYFYSLPR